MIRNYDDMVERAKQYATTIKAELDIKKGKTEVVVEKEPAAGYYWVYDPYLCRLVRRYPFKGGTHA